MNCDVEVLEVSKHWQHAGRFKSYELLSDYVSLCLVKSVCG